MEIKKKKKQKNSKKNSEISFAVTLNLYMHVCTNTINKLVLMCFEFMIWSQYY